jgi:hypothetical protein
VGSACETAWVARVCTASCRRGPALGQEMPRQLRRRLCRPAAPARARENAPRNRAGPSRSGVDRRLRRQRLSSSTERRSRYCSRLSSPSAKRRSSTSIPVSRPPAVHGERPLRPRTTNTMPTMSRSQNRGPDRIHPAARKSHQRCRKLHQNHRRVPPCSSMCLHRAFTLTPGWPDFYPGFPLRAPGASPIAPHPPRGNQQRQDTAEERVSAHARREIALPLDEERERCAPASRVLLPHGSSSASRSRIDGKAKLWRRWAGHCTLR